jgi:hypothetical protein
MSQSAPNSRVAEALSDDQDLGSREDWWGDPRTEDERRKEVDCADPNDPAEIIAHKLLRETATVICAATLQDDTWNGGRMAELFAFHLGQEDDFERNHAIHHQNEAIELTDPAIRLGNHDPNSSVVGESGTERHRKRYNALTGYISGNETTRVLIQDRPLEDLMIVIEQWLRGVAARSEFGISEREVDECLNLARGLKKNTHQNGFRDVDIMAKVVDKVRR